MTGGTHIDVQAVLPCNTHQYYIERDSAAFRALLSNALSLGVYKFRDTWRDPDSGSTFVRLVTKPEISSWVPSAVRNAVANASEIEFHDIIEYRPSDTSGPTYTLHVRTESPFLGDKLHVNTKLELIPLTQNTTLQRLSGTVCVRMFGFGSLIEKAVRDNLIKTYHQLPEIVSRWETYRAEVLGKGEEGDPSAAVLLAGRPPVGGDLEYIRSIMHAPSVPMVAPSTTITDGLVTVSSGEISLKKEEEFSEEKEKEAVVVKRHSRRRTASELILDALELSSPDSNNINNLYSTTTEQLNNQVAPRHWRGFSWDSVGSQGSEVPTDLEERIPGSKGAHTAWRRFNRDYAVWDSYWAQIGVHAATVAQRGVLKVFYCIRKELAVVGRLLALFLLLLLVRVHVLRVGSNKDRDSSLNNKSGSEKEREEEKTPSPPQQQHRMTRRSSSRLGKISS